MKLKVKKLGPFGLMFRRTPKIPVLIRLDGRGIHTWFCRGIDAVFTDTNGIIVDIRSFIAPFSRYKPRFPPAFVVEFPAGGARDLRLGDRLDFEIV